MCASCVDTYGAREALQGLFGAFVTRLSLFIIHY